MEDNFDKHIKDSLDKLGEDFTPESWDLLHQKMMLDPSLSAPQSEDGFFDENIKEKLNQVEANYDPMHWEAMESRLDHLTDQPSVDDLELDGLVYENLKDLRIPFSQAHWTLMSNRLDEEFSIRRKLYKYKVAEVSLMLLALFTLFQYLPLNKKQQATAIPPQQEKQVTANEINQLASIPPVQFESETATDASISTIEGNDPIHSTKGTHHTAEAQASQSTAPVIIDTPPTEEADLNSAIPATTVLASESEAKPNDQNQANVSPILLESLGTPQIGFGQTINRLAALKSLINQSSNAISANLLSSDNLTLNSLSLVLSSTDRELPTAYSFDQFRKSVQLRVGMFISSDFNEIMTPEKVYPNFVDAAYQQVTAGYGGGISLGFRYKKLEFETGLSYARLSYEPNKTLITTGSFIRSSIQREVFDAAFLNIVKIPMHLNYSFERNSKWHFYAIGGASINILALNHFNFTTSSVGAGSATPREKAPTYDGIFNGGNLKANSYYTANIGMGLERNLTDRWSIFMQPVYQHLLYRKGFGPNKDQFNTLSIQIGAKSTFK